MTNKKLVVKKAKKIRKVIKGLDLPTSIKLAKLHTQGRTFDFLGVLTKAGYSYTTDFVYSSCDTCGFHTHGRIVISKKGRRLFLKYDDGIVFDDVVVF